MTDDLFHEDVPRPLRAAGWALFAAGMAGLYGPLGIWLSSLAGNVEMHTGIWRLMLLYPACWALSVLVLLLGGWALPRTRSDAHNMAGWTLVAYPIWTVSFSLTWLRGR